MSNPIRRLPLAAACAALALLVLAPTALALVSAPGAEPAAAAIHFQHESYQQLLTQLRNREVHAVVLHPKGYKAHVSLDNGGHMTVTYVPAEESRLAEEVRASGASFAVAASTHKAAPVHHKLRYIAGGVLIVVILIVLVVLLIGRRRALDEEGSGHGDGAASAPPAGSG
ncbi:MAG TPA: hypothetical protein VNY52_00205 [Solirubrobacteraceae bacterium]|nr:hypothetical protein [Solirubrobacteraceae bacterium]